MPRFIAVHPVSFTEEQLQPLAKEPMPEGVAWVGTYCGVEDDRSFCEWEAPAREPLLEIFAKYQIPYETLHHVLRFDPATGALERERELAEVG